MMTLSRLVVRSLRFHIRSHLGVVLGAAVGSAALIGALVVGDSVRGSLRELGLARLGRIQLALVSNDRLLRSQLADDLQKMISDPVAPALQLPGTAVRSDGTARANGVQILGVDERFWALATRPSQMGTDPETVVLNSSLARQLNVAQGDTVLLRVQKPSLLSREAPITPQEDFNVALRLPVAAIVSDEELGRFSLRANQIPPFNAFVPLALLQERLAVAGRANLLLVGESGPAAGAGAGPADTKLAQTQEELAQIWQLADIELELVRLTNVSQVELRSKRIFLEEPIVNAAEAISDQASLVLAYFVNELKVGERSTPYSMVAGLEPPGVPEGMGDDEILINPWLAEDLQAKPGDEMELTYYVVGTGRRLELAREKFQVRGVVPFEGLYADPHLMPEFPGVAKAESTKNWDAGFPIDLTKVREKDEQYWTNYRGTPKGFITLAAAQRMWANRFGKVTAVRYPAGSDPARLGEELLETLDPASVALSFQPVRAQALAASSEAMDFGQLFIGFSFFLIVAALVLMGLLFQFALEQRAVETGTLLALGFLPKQVRRLMMLEGTALAFVGGIIGMLGGVGYARAMLYGLTTLWRDAVGVSVLGFHVTLVTLLTGLVASVLVSAMTIGLVLRKQARQPARELLAEGSELDWQAPASGRLNGGVLLAAVSGLGAFALVGWALWRGETAAAGIFFGAGALLLIAGLGLTSGLFTAFNRSEASKGLSVTVMGLRNCARRRRRSLATTALLACGSFIVAAVGANKLDANRDAGKRSSGTGGFALIGHTSLPVVHDLNSQEGRDFFGLDESEMAGVEVVPFRVRDGDDASCLNLNRAQTPRLLGVRPEFLQNRNAFTVGKVAEGLAAEQRWLLLEQKPGDGAVPAMGDQASIQWALEKKLGDTLTYLDERGRSFEVRLAGGLANSILQGNLIIEEKEFTQRFPGESGYRMFLFDVPSNKVATVSATLTRALQDVGLELTPAPARLNAFNAVQNTYLNTFQVLGGLGLLLGSAGLGVVVLRNVLERRGELALLQAVGFRKKSLQWLVLSEHGALLLLGLGVGAIAALVAVFPVLFAPGAEVEYLSLGVTLAAVFLSGLVWTGAATWLALRGKLLAALRNE